MTTSLRQAARGGVPARSRDYYLEAGSEYVRLYGADQMTAASFSPPAAKRGGRPDLVERYYKGRTCADGSWPDGDPVAWPSLNAIKKAFGSWNAFRDALELPANTTVPMRGRRKPGEAEPILNVRDRRVAAPSAGNTTWLRRQLEKAERRAERLAEELDAEKSKNDAETPREVELRRRLSDEAHRRKDVQRELHNAVRREARARATSARGDRRQDAAALREVDRLTQRLVVAQDRIRDLSTAETLRPQPKPKEKTRTRTVTKTVQDAVLLRNLERLEAQVTELRASAARSEAARAELAERLATIRRDAISRAVATQRVQVAERRVTEVEKRMAEQAEVLVGERRQLTNEEIARLRRDGPAGDVLFIGAVKKIGRAEGKAARKLAIYNALIEGYSWMETL